MRVSSIAKRYAHALFDSVEVSRRDKVGQILSELVELIATNNDLREALDAPVYEAGQKAEVLKSIIGDAALKEHSDFGRFLDILVEQGRVERLSEISYAYAVSQLRSDGVATLNVVTAKEQTDEEKAGIKEILKNLLDADISIQWEIDQALIGGCLVRYNDIVLDLSVSSGLKELEQTLLAQ